jgi:hypothetical protein
MVELQMTRVQCLPLYIEAVLALRIDRVTDYRMPYVRHVDAYLVRAASIQPAPDKGIALAAAEHFEVGNCRLSAFVDYSHAFAMHRVSPYRSLDAPRIGWDGSVHDG